MGPALERMPIEVLVDGGKRDGQIVRIGSALAAVLVRVGRDDADLPEPEGWFLEAGFGPCSTLMVKAPSVFASEHDALLWVEQRLRSAGYL